MVGAIAGDIIGSVYEGCGMKRKIFPLFRADSTFTDDSVLTIALADTILTGTPYIDNIYIFSNLYPRRGYGRSSYIWASDKSRSPYSGFGNAAAMRISPVGFSYDDMDTVLSMAKEFTEITHKHPEGIKGAQATAAAVYLARIGKSKDDIKDFIETEFKYDLSQHIIRIRPNYHFDISCQGTVPQAIRAFYDSTDFEDAIRNAVSLGGDSDTLACIAGGIAQGFYGSIPEFIESNVYEILDEKLGAITKKFMRKYCSGE